MFIFWLMIIVLFYDLMKLNFIVEKNKFVEIEYGKLNNEEYDVNFG